jgi:hypothetical protein
MYTETLSFNESIENTSIIGAKEEKDGKRHHGTIDCVAWFDCSGSLYRDHQLMPKSGVKN